MKITKLDKKVNWWNLTKKCYAYIVLTTPS